MSANSKPYEAFGLSCPSGGNFYVCQGNATEFIGCCTTNPCADGSGKCPTADLRTSSFSADSYEDLPRQDCDDSRSFNIWYTCKFNQPPFVGCCNTNPCAEGSCPREDLVPAKLSGDTNLREAFLSPTVSGSSASSTATAESQIQVTHNGGLSAGAIAGIVAGAAVVVILVVGVLMYRCGFNARWRRERKADWPLMAGYDGETGDMAAMSSPFSGMSPPRAIHFKDKRHEAHIHAGSCSSGMTWGAKRHPGSPYFKDGEFRSPKHEHFPSSSIDEERQHQSSPRLLDQGAVHDKTARNPPVELAGAIPSELEAPLFTTSELEATVTPKINTGSAFPSREPSPVPPVYIAPVVHSTPTVPPPPQRLGRPIAPMLRDERDRSASRGRIRRVERVEDFRPSTRGLSQGA